MRERKFATLVLVLAIVVSTFTGKDVMAIDENCTFIGQNGASTGISMQISRENGVWPVYDANLKQYDYRYLITGLPTLTTLPLVDFLLPVCSAPIPVTSSSGGQPPVIGLPGQPPAVPPATGVASNGFGWWTIKDFVVRVTQNPSFGGFVVSYSIPSEVILPLRNTSAALQKVTNSYSACKSIAAPACDEYPGLPFQPATINTCMKVEGKNVLIVRNESRCITEIWDCGQNEGCPGGTGGGSCAPLYENVDVTVTCVAGQSCQAQDAITAGDILGNQICPEAILFSASSPGCSNVRTLSGWVQVCR